MQLEACCERVLSTIHDKWMAREEAVTQLIVRKVIQDESCSHLSVKGTVGGDAWVCFRLNANGDHERVIGFNGRNLS